MTRKDIPWEELRARYEAGTDTYRSLAQRYGVSECWIGKRARAEDWRRPSSRSRQRVEEQCLLAVAAALRRAAEQAAAHSGEMNPKELKEMTGVLRELVQLRQAIAPQKEEQGGSVQIMLEGETEEWSR